MSTKRSNSIRNSRFFISFLVSFCFVLFDFWTQFFLSYHPKGNNHTNSEIDVDSNSYSSSRRGSEMDSVSESGLRLSNYKIKLSPLNRTRRKNRSNSININPTTLKNEVLHIEGVMFFLSDSRGICGDLTVSSKKLRFASGMLDNSASSDSALEIGKQIQKHPVEPKCLIRDEINVNYYEIDFLNVGELHKEIANDYYNLIIHCQNFKHVKVSLKKTTDADAFIDRLKGIHDDNTIRRNMFPRVCLWEYLFKRYQYKEMSDWNQYEKWYIANFNIQFSQFNETNLCETLPKTIIVPRVFVDNRLETILSASIGHRVPVVTFLYRKNSHVIIRSTSFANNNTLQAFLNQALTPFRELDIDSIMPQIDDVERSYSRLRQKCFNVAKIGHNNNDLKAFYSINYSQHFWAKCSVWLNLISRALQKANQLVNIITNEASVGLVERFDSNWNCVLSSLVQVLLDPNRRTVEGFESLLSKEWIYLSGYKSHDPSMPQKRLHSPNITLFILFIDAIHQIMVQNPCAFEFTTTYLIALIDNLFVTETITREKCKIFEANKSHCLMYNPLFNSETRATIKQPTVKHHIVHLKLFYKLYIRNIKSDIYNHTPVEYFYCKELEKRSII